MNSSDTRRILAVAVRRDLVCIVHLQGRQLRDWRVSRKAARTPEDAVAILKRWLAIYDPDVVICQNPDMGGRKGQRNLSILRALARAISDEDLLDVLVIRKFAYQNIYEEAAVIAERYPALKHKLPKKPRIWETEPRQIIYFEAMALALLVLNEG